MLCKALSDYPPTLINHCIEQIDFFAGLVTADPQQLLVLMQHTCLIELEAGEVLIEKDTIGSAFYSLVRGQLAIFPEKRLADTAICELLPSQIVGALAMLNQQPRTATVAVSSVDGALVLATDFTVFGELTDCSVISLSTKLSLFRHVVQHIYHTLQQLERDIPDTRLSEELSALMLYQHQQGTLDELEHLAELATGLAWLLDCWNHRITPCVPMFSEKALEAKLMALMKSGGLR